MTQSVLFGKSNQNSQSLKTSSVYSLQMADLIFSPCLNKSLKPNFQFLLVGQMQDWLNAKTVKFAGAYSILNTSERPSAAVASSLSAVLEQNVPHKYYLSQKACQGILRRATTKGKQLPPPHFRRAFGLGRDAFNCGQNAKFGLSLSENVQPPLTARGAGAVFDGYVIRKLTPLESERLMGLPDNWTEGISDSQRYKMIGNGMAQPVADFILRGVIL